MFQTWYSIEGSLREFRQIAQVSAQISQDHIVTAFHFLISKRGPLDADDGSSFTVMFSSIFISISASPTSPSPLSSPDILVIISCHVVATCTKLSFCFLMFQSVIISTLVAIGWSFNPQPYALNHKALRARTVGYSNQDLCRSIFYNEMTNFYFSHAPSIWSQ